LLANPTAMATRPVAHPGVWRGSDFDDLAEITFELSHHHLAALDRALERARARRCTLEAIVRDDFPLDHMGTDLAAIRNEVMHGRGVVLLRGLPVSRYTIEDLSLLFWGLGTHFGRATSQSLLGDRLGHVTDVSGEDPNERGYRSRRELVMHTDSDDLVMMLCVNDARAGGESRFVSALTIYNELLETQPDLLCILKRGFRYHWRGEQADGEPPITDYRVPVFSERDGLVSCVYLRAFIDMASDDLGSPLSAGELAALEHFESVADDPELQLRVTLEPGDAYLINNYTVLHSRTRFVDNDPPRPRRHLLRLWLKADETRPVVDQVRRFYRDDGITKRNGASTLYVHEAAG
jgi:hypothetical protein